MKRADVQDVLGLAVEAEKGLASPERSAWIEELTQASDRIRSALRWLLDRGEVESGLGLLGNLYWFFAEDEGQCREARAWYHAFLTGLGTDPTLTRAQALDQAAGLALNGGDYAEAGQLAEDALAVRRDLGDLSGVGYSLCHLGHIAQETGDTDRAWRLRQEALEIFRRLADRSGIMAATSLLGELALDRDDAFSAALFVREAIHLAWDLQQDVLDASHLDLAASYALAIGQPRSALRLAGAADAQRRRLGLLLEPVKDGTPAHTYLVKLQRRWDTIRDAIGEHERAALWTEGQELAMADAFALAFDIVAMEPPRR